MNLSPPSFGFANATKKHLNRYLLVSLKAYEAHDSELARETASLDDEIDSAEKAITEQVFAWQSEHPDDFIISAYTLWITHSLERIGDRATNIAERVVYIATIRQRI